MTFLEQLDKGDRKMTVLVMLVVCGARVLQLGGGVGVRVHIWFRAVACVRELAPIHISHDRFVIADGAFADEFVPAWAKIVSCVFHCRLCGMIRYTYIMTLLCSLTETQQCPIPVTPQTRCATPHYWVEIDGDFSSSS